APSPEAPVELAPVVAPAPGHAYPQVALGLGQVLHNGPAHPHGEIEAGLGALAVVGHVFEVVEDVDAAHEPDVVVDHGDLAMQAPQSLQPEAKPAQAGGLGPVDAHLRAHFFEPASDFRRVLVTAETVDHDPHLHAALAGG